MFGDRLRDARMLRDYKQEDLAKLVGVSDGTISNWEISKNLPTVRNAISLCAVLPELRDDLIYIAEIDEMRKLKQEIDDLKAERDVWRNTTFDLLKEKQQWQQSSGV